MAAADLKKFRALNEEVLFNTDPMLIIGARDIQILKNGAQGNKRQRIRLCAHRDEQDALHEMLIVHTKDAYVRPHKHLRCESFHVIEGRADVVVFADGGEVASVIRLGEYGSGLPFYYRLDQACYHSLIIRSDLLVFHETKQGPFDPAGTLFPRWAPDGTDRAARDLYLERLAAAVETFLSDGAPRRLVVGRGLRIED